MMVARLRTLFLVGSLSYSSARALRIFSGALSVLTPFILFAQIASPISTSFPTVSLLDANQNVDPVSVELVRAIAEGFDNDSTLIPPSGPMPLVIVINSLLTTPLTPLLPDDSGIYAIYLSGRGGRYWSQIAYQFGHELIHVYYNGNQVPAATIIEESIAETGSYLALRLAYNFFLSTASPYATAVESYIEENDSIMLTQFTDRYGAGASPVDSMLTLSSTVDRALNWKISLAFRKLIDGGMSLGDFRPLTQLTSVEVITTPLTDLPDSVKGLVQVVRPAIQSALAPDKTP